MKEKPPKKRRRRKGKGFRAGQCSETFTNEDPNGSF
jgi:hypothetical protein